MVTCLLIAALGSPGQASAGPFVLESEDGNFELDVGAYLQPRFEYQDRSDGSRTSHFRFNEARFGISGHAYTPRLRYKFLTEFGSGFVELKDYYLEYALVPERLNVRVGQFKRPFAREELTSSTKRAFLDASIVNETFPTGRDLGVMFHRGGPIEYAVGVFNGTGAGADFTGSDFSNVPRSVRPAVVARVGYGSEDLEGYSHADLEGGDPRYGIGASTHVEFDADGGEDARGAVEADFIFKAHGFSASGGYALMSRQRASAAGDQVRAAGGVYAQASYVWAGRFAPAVRYAQVREVAGAVLHEGVASFSAYFRGHNLKWQTEVGVLSQEAGTSDATAIRGGSQVQLKF